MVAFRGLGERSAASAWVSTESIHPYRDPVVPSEMVGLGWVPGGFKYLLRYLDFIGTPKRSMRLEDMPPH